MKPKAKALEKVRKEVKLLGKHEKQEDKDEKVERREIGKIKKAVK